MTFVMGGSGTVIFCLTNQNESQSRIICTFRATICIMYTNFAGDMVESIIVSAHDNL